MEYTFIARDVDFDGDTASKLVLAFKAESLDEMLMYMDMFLKGSGYCYKGELTILENE
jgi:hypothetical protein